mmetsp:Transcript_29260/g.47115  ORF Transcript_29260/g.47115 Transcript_29260/m.47115 type:complete len:85 (-) Transcript_29260:176-430(-)
MRPSLNTNTLSDDLIVLKRCAIVIDVPAFATTLSSVSWTSFSVRLSSAAVASSNSSNLGFRKSALAIQVLCFCPPESVPPLAPT